MEWNNILFDVMVYFGENRNFVRKVCLMYNYVIKIKY